MKKKFKDVVVVTAFLCVFAALVTFAGMLACGAPPVEASSPSIPELTRLKAVEAGSVEGNWSPYVYILEDTQTDEHYAIAKFGEGITFIKLSK